MTECNCDSPNPSMGPWHAIGCCRLYEVCTCRTVVTDEYRVKQQVNPTCPLHATYTASEVKVLTETASKVAYALGRKDAGEEIATALERCEDDARRAEQKTHKEVWFHLAAGYMRSAELAREVASRPSQAASDATSGVPGHQEVSEAVRSPQEDFEAGTRFLVVEIPPEAGLEYAETLVELVADVAYSYEVEGQDWDPFVYGWTFPDGQAVERPKRAKTNASSPQEPCGHPDCPCTSQEAR